jgi:hypothetical protein
MVLEAKSVMLLSEMREELLAQHQGLRELAGAARETAEALVAGDASVEIMRQRLAALGQALIAHNRREEELLGSIIRTIDAWGDVRAALLDEHHAAAHGELRRNLDDAFTTDDASLAARLTREAVEQLFEHMRIEERDVLSADAFRDDVVVIDAIGS